MRRRTTDTPEIPIAPMIDCVFLMLVYFMTTSSLEKSEADLAFPAGEAGLSADPLPAVDEQELALRKDGHALWNGAVYSIVDSSGEAALSLRLKAFQQTCVQARSTPSVRIKPDPGTPHQAIVTLLDALTRSGIETVHFP